MPPHAAIVLLAVSMMILAQSRAADLENRLTQAIDNKAYANPTRTEWLQARDLFQRTLQGPWDGRTLSNRWAALGFEFREVMTSDESLWLLSETAGKERGGGWYLFRTNRYSNVVLQAPHARNDIHTGRIGLQLFLDGRAHAFAAATVSRHNADMAHLDHTLFQAFTLAFIESDPAGWVIQLHGFSSTKHPNAKADIIASAGTESPGPWLTDITQQLRENTTLQIRSYPNDTSELGATLNAQGRALRHQGHHWFLHLELSRDLRERLIEDDPLRGLLLESLPPLSPR